MAIVLNKSKEGGARPPAGWHVGTVTQCEQGTFNESKFFDVMISELPENMKCRVWEARNSEGEEFSISNLIRYSNPDILEETSNGTDPAIKVDDTPKSLVGKRLQVYVYEKDNGYMDILQNKVAPAEPFSNSVDKMTEERIRYIKNAAVKYFNNKVSTNGAAVSKSEEEEVVPF